MKITHIISTDLKRNVNAIADDLLRRSIYVVDILIPINNIFINVPKTLNAAALRDIDGVKAISPNYEISV